MLINSTKYACQACIKGHRSSSCTHSDRPLFEIKKKGRPPAICAGGCGEPKRSCACATRASSSRAKPAALKEDSEEEEDSTEGTLLEEELSPVVTTASDKKGKKKRRKDVTLEPPALPNGIQDYLALSSAAELLSGLINGTDVVETESKFRVDTLLNPCNCDVPGSVCDCPVAKSRAEAAAAAASARAASQAPPMNILPKKSCCLSRPAPPLPLPSETMRRLSTDALIEDFRRSISVSGPHDSASPSISSPLAHSRHRSTHFSPYPISPSSSSSATSSSGRGGGGPGPARNGRNSHLSNLIASQGVTRESLPVLFEMFVQELISSNPTGARPPLETFLRAGRGEDGGTMVSACSCGDGCACPGCEEHGNGNQGSPSHRDDCPDTCTSCTSCTGFSVPASVGSIEDILAAAGSKLPAAPPPRASAMSLAQQATDTSILPPSVVRGGGLEEGRQVFGLVELPKLECCGNRCRCPPGECFCMKDDDCRCGDATTPKASDSLVDPDRVPNSCCASQPTVNDAGLSSSIPPSTPSLPSETSDPASTIAVPQLPSLPPISSFSSEPIPRISGRNLARLQPSIASLSGPGSNPASGVHSSTRSSVQPITLSSYDPGKAPPTPDEFVLDPDLDALFAAYLKDPTDPVAHPTSPSFTFQDPLEDWTTFSLASSASSSLSSSAASLPSHMPTSISFPEFGGIDFSFDGAVAAPSPTGDIAPSPFDAFQQDELDRLLLGVAMDPQTAGLFPSPPVFDSDTDWQQYLGDGALPDPLL